MATISEPNHLSGLFGKKSPMKIGLYYFTECIWRLIELIISIHFIATVHEPPRDMFHHHSLHVCNIHMHIYKHVHIQFRPKIRLDFES